jgi:hypothetical protein
VIEQFRYSRNALHHRAKRLSRIFEILPAVLSFTIILGMLILTLLDPVLAALVIVAFVLSWLLRMLYTNTFLILSYLHLKAERETDWLERIRNLEDPGTLLEELRQQGGGRSWRERLSNRTYRREIETLVGSGKLPPSWKEIYHLVIFPIARESAEIFQPGLESIAGCDFPSGRMLIVLAVEESAPAQTKIDAEAMRKRYADTFLGLLVVIHPSGLPGEAKVKGANASYAARKAEAYFRERMIALENIIISCFDADTVVDPGYFSCLTYHFLVNPDRTRASYQPIPLYQNNLWQAPGFARVLDVGSSFFQLVEATNPEKLVTFSSHSMSFKALVDIDYWPADMISDDSAIYWKALIEFRGDYRVVPMYTTVSMDITQAENWRKTVVNVYKQKRRWAWGVENVPLVVSAFLLSGEIPLPVRIKQAFKLLQTHVSWTTWPILLGIMSWLPAVFMHREFTTSVVTYSEPRILSTMFTLAFGGYLTYVLLSQLFLPRIEGKLRILKRIGHVFEWLLVPPISIIFGAIPALDAQTRLMLGKYMEFWVTEKKRKPSS